MSVDRKWSTKLILVHSSDELFYSDPKTAWFPLLYPIIITDSK